MKPVAESTTDMFGPFQPAVSFYSLKLELREKIVQMEKQKETEIEAIRENLTTAQRQVEDGASNYREQIKQHSVTICAMEERLNKVMKKNKDYQNEITSLKSTIQGIIFVRHSLHLFFASVTRCDYHLLRGASQNKLFEGPKPSHSKQTHNL